MNENNQNIIYLSTNLRFLRKQKNVTLQEVGNAINKTDGAINHWEKGIREPSAIDLYSLAKYYGVSVDDLVKKDLRFENVNPIGKEITRDEFINDVKDLIDKCINMSEEDKKYYKRVLDIKE